MILGRSFRRQQVSLLQWTCRTRGGHRGEVAHFRRFMHFHSLLRPVIENGQPILAQPVVRNEVPIGGAGQPTFHFTGPGGGRELRGQLIQVFGGSKRDLRDVVQHPFVPPSNGAQDAFAHAPRINPRAIGAVPALRRGHQLVQHGRFEAIRAVADFLQSTHAFLHHLTRDDHHHHGLLCAIAVKHRRHLKGPHRITQRQRRKALELQLHHAAHFARVAERQVQHAEEHVLRRHPRIVLAMRIPHLAGVALEEVCVDRSIRLGLADVHELEVLFALGEPPKLLLAGGTIHHVAILRQWHSVRVFRISRHYKFPAASTGALLVTSSLTCVTRKTSSTEVTPASARIQPYSRSVFIPSLRACWAINEAGLFCITSC